MKRIGVVGTILLALVLLAGCGALRTGSTDPNQARFQLDSVDGRVGKLRLLGVAIESTGGRGSTHLAGSNAALLLTVANDGEADDVITDVSAESAKRVVYRNADAAAESHFRVIVPAGGVTVLREVSGPHLELTGLRETLRSGLSVPVTFGFRDAGTVTL